jgi:hypothetical protein
VTEPATGEGRAARLPAQPGRDPARATGAVRKRVPIFSAIFIHGQGQSRNI